MKSTPDETARRRELKKLVEMLGKLAWARYPEVAPSGVVRKSNSYSAEGTIDYDEFYVYEKEAESIIAKDTDGKIRLRFRRRVTSDMKYRSLWHFWEPGYAATKPETVSELIPCIQSLIEKFREN